MGHVTLCQTLLIVCNHSARPDCHRHCNRGDIIDLIFHVTLEDHVIQELCDFMKENSPLYIPYPAKFGCHKHWDNGYTMILVCHVI